MYARRTGNLNDLPAKIVEMRRTIQATDFIMLVFILISGYRQGIASQFSSGDQNEIKNQIDQNQSAEPNRNNNNAEDQNQTPEGVDSLKVTHAACIRCCDSVVTSGAVAEECGEGEDVPAEDTNAGSEHEACLPMMTDRCRDCGVVGGHVRRSRWNTWI